MKSNLVAAITTVMLLFSSCNDDTTSPPPIQQIFSVRISVKNMSGAPVTGLRISVWNHLSINLSGMQSSTNIQQRSLKPTAASSIGFNVRTTSKVTLKVMYFDDSPVSTLVNEVMSDGMYTVHWFVDSIIPSSVYKYQLIAKHPTNDSLLFQDTKYAVLYRGPDIQQTIIGWTSNNGVFETNDIRLFPNVLDLPVLVQTLSSGPEPINTFTFRDTVSIVLTDTTSHQQMAFIHVIKKGVLNDIQLVWDPTLSLQWMPYTDLIPQRGEAIQTRRLSKVITAWKLYQNYPNPFN